MLSVIKVSSIRVTFILRKDCWCFERVWWKRRARSACHWVITAVDSSFFLLICDSRKVTRAGKADSVRKKGRVWLFLESLYCISVGICHRVKCKSTVFALYDDHNYMKSQLFLLLFPWDWLKTYSSRSWL